MHSGFQRSRVRHYCADDVNDVTVALLLFIGFGGVHGFFVTWNLVSDEHAAACCNTFSEGEFCC